MQLFTKFAQIVGLGIGEKSALKLKKMGLETPWDLFFDFPRKYEDYATITKISTLSSGHSMEVDAKGVLGNNYAIKGMILGISNKKTRRRGFTVTEGVIADGSGSLRVIWFNQPYIQRMLRVNQELTFYGKVLFDSYHQSLVMESPAWSNSAKINPIYSETAGVTSNFLTKLFSKVESAIKEIDEWLPESILDKYKLLGIHEALCNVHKPKSPALLQASKRRLGFDELFFISLQGAISREDIKKTAAPTLAVQLDDLKAFINKLPFTLTNDQKKAVWQIVKDLEQKAPMHRLLNGDVGSGKTIVAAIASYVCVKSSYRVLLMVPTEILALQHYETFKQVLKPFGITVGIATASQKENLDAEVLIGTHTLIQKDFCAEKVGLVIVDEQHRFGVNQRAELKNKTTIGKYSPHFLSMTATPIPRTLHLALFGDLEVSLIKEKPAERKEVKTRFVEPFNRDKAYDFISSQISKGRQAFVICPLIEEKNSDESSIKEPNLFETERKSVKAEHLKLQKVFPQLKIAMLHGKMKPQEKAEVMERFKDGKAQVLISTCVVEVGVDVPNASVMIIEDAERFGLAQIHQFRGRVGRGEYQSYCLLFSNTQSLKALDRLHWLEEINDGFKLAEVDLEMRGPGAIFGTEQSGMFDLKMASMSDREMIIDASNAAKEIASQIDRYPKIKERLEGFSTSKHLE